MIEKKAWLNEHRTSVVVALIGLVGVLAIPIIAVVADDKEAEPSPSRTVLLSPSSGAPGTNVRVTGSNWTKDVEARVEIQGNVLDVGTVSDGGLVADIRISPQAPIGNYRVDVIGEQSGERATVTFTVR